MLIEVKVPALSESVAEATLIAWHKKQGEQVERDENLIDIETDKVVLELPAPKAGVLKEIIKGDGETVTSGEVIAMIDTEAAEAESDAQPDTEKSQKAAKNQPKTDKSDEDKEKAEDQKPERKADPTIPMLMPAARKLVEENQLKASETHSIKGTGRGGRITREDVQAYIDHKSEGDQDASTGETQTDKHADESTETDESQQAQQAQQSSATGGARERIDRRVTMSRLRMRIAERLVQSQSTAAILTTFNEVNMQAVIDLRTRYRTEFEKEHGVKLGFMSFFVKAVVAALKKYPIVNASVEGNEIIYHDYYDVGIAVGSPRGLVVPILRNADRMTFAQIETQIADFAKRARDGKLTLEELTGGTFSITNGGVFGSMLSTPIINPPQSAILGIHATKDRAVVENGQIVIRPMNYLALSYDHRIIDGREAVLALVAIKEALEYPMSPLLET
ncbi:MAG: 2-oxoglutarate dehydrogenase complex dihydrolipoyllysine-residue succinyltransferase [Burkholderiales bacterium]|uniref:2-oxoglutarate dehydrogenase complex dihydrolipoyllysine-residue succinyltransferase n=1 Tax=Nitrosomonas sp. TaxID=42353 RepID=UPI001D2ACEA4|nr:2-oxoglutarate dehydrogenase complex dihydrolipoyllysine-residue succinyltransferase [Nitrosomonas sp.]MCB1948316.1 2-oxoglutarate dehydrogenase complex dihydrolipoyllysine-residue succinyltransferase [Nitrosomonas sp.]MCP5243001.1 2-oxoglutarate dehydrogenase complex dihydrolipoyllysine-residue succinyltransferase [Burkholderiales bacterium]